jgi:hypothetical protein
MKQRQLILALLACLLLVPARARLGEKLDELKKRYGTPAPQAQKDSGSAVWFFEGEDGQLAYSVRFDAKGRSIAEGLKPVGYAIFSRNTVQNFIDGQLAPYRDSKTMLRVNPGEKYGFGGKSYVCGSQEMVIVDDANNLLIVWSRGGVPMVLAATHASMQ